MTAPGNANRCTPCLEGTHDRCSGSAGNVGCGCVHADWPSSSPVLDPAVVRRRLAELNQRIQVQQQVVDRLDALLDDERRELVSLQRGAADMRAHPAVVAALAQRTPGPQWTRAERRTDGHVLRLDRNVTTRVVLDVASQTLWLAPLGTPYPDGDGWLLGYLTAGPPAHVTP